MKWLRYLLIAFAVPLVIAMALPFLVALDDYIPQIEKAVSARLNEPVSIESIKFAVLPLPHLTFDGITVGATNEIRIGKVHVTPDPFSMLQTIRVIRSIEIDSLILTQRAIDKIPAWARPDSRRAAASQGREHPCRQRGGQARQDELRPV